MSRFVYFVVLLIFFSPLFAEDFCDKAYWDASLIIKQEKCRKIAEQGNDEAQFGYGLILLGGHDRVSKPNEAFEWFIKSAKQGNHLAQTILGRMLSDSRFGVPLNLPEAYAWWAVSKNIKSANELWLRLTPEQQEKAKELEKIYASTYFRK
ncbi:hypothetical protein A3195_08235 [Candidatus Thiodiazotropha endoloripes]|uniref:tetratricopeptide repeat protein n=1 Tax=Candidatus Thiodiazotropha endoloripes TaxID=1818881 RepID=UPI00083D9FBE|nr:SEL1-like repeat protein [Candidatus Thiodiazotropha endoloripes]ODB84251.1 hypothetical protein A3193_15670 [Candidatus Thiodiazotropha endoloripes]ODB91382.1 hypothetical protein A3195_08235 [Candidatus Thiodiazotropha endoloripes]